MFGIDDAALVMGGAQLLGGMMGADAAKDASNAQGQASAASIAEQRRQFDLSRGDSAPYREAGGASVTRLRDLLGIGVGSKGYVPNSRTATGDPIYDKLISQWSPELLANTDEASWQSLYNSIIKPQYEHLRGPQPASTGEFGDSPLTRSFTVGDFYKDPVTELSMKYGLDLGTKGINQGASAGGMRRSGETLKALTRFGTDYAGTKAGESEGRFKNTQDRIFNMFSGLAGTGQTATTNANAQGQQTAANIGNTMTAQGNARGAAGIAGSNAWNNSFNNIGQWWNQDQTMNKFMAMRGGGLPGIADQTRIS